MGAGGSDFSSLALAAALGAAVAYGTLRLGGGATERQTSIGTFKLYYFDFPGKAEPIRAALTYSGLQFEDIRLSREEFVAMKKAGTFKFGQVPALVTPDGEQLVQSSAILRYIGRVAAAAGDERLYPTDLRTAQRVDAAMAQEDDVFIGLRALKYERNGFPAKVLTDEAKAVVANELSTSVIPRHLGLFSKLLEGNADSDAYIAGTAEPSAADFVLFETFKMIDGGLGIADFPKGLIQSDFPLIAAYMKRFAEHPDVKRWYN